MLNYNKTIGLPIMISGTNKEVGNVRELIINFENGKLLGFLLSEGLLKEQRVLRLEDVKEIKNDGIFVVNDNAIKPLNNFNLFVELLDKKIKIKDNNVVTESGKELGKVYNFFLDDISYRLEKLYVKANFLRDLFKGKLIISFEKIVSIGQNEIVVKDDLVKEKLPESVVTGLEQKEMVSDVMPTQIKTDL